jgi:sirohydrochlorin cobaltochelatase
LRLCGEKVRYWKTMSRTTDEAILLFAHGARDPAWAKPFERIAERIRGASPGLRVELAFLELMAPALPEAIERLAGEGVGRVTLVPLFLAQGGHLKQDLPGLLAEVRQRHPQMRIEVTDAIGDVPALTDAIADWALSRHQDAG